MRSFALAAIAPLASAVLYPGQSNLNHTCVVTSNPIDPLVESCSPLANPSLVDSCCVETYGGLLLSTQFWSTYTGLESQGQYLPKDSWTLHGLWPDFCNGSYTQYCDLTRQYDRFPSPNTTNGLANGTKVPPYRGAPISTFIEAFGKYDLLSYMNKYWINQGANNSDFWEHEFSKHATCFSTFDIPCYGPQYRQHEEVIDFFETAIAYYRRVPTFQWLAAAGLKPSNSTKYSIADFQSALSTSYGALPYIGCSGPRYNETDAGKGSMDNGRIFISEVWYYFHSFGRPQNNLAIQTNATGSVTSCARTKGAITYPERSSGSVRAY